MKNLLIVTGRVVLFAVVLIPIGACSSNPPRAETLCLRAVGELDLSIERYEELLEEAVAQMRSADPVEKLEAISSEYSLLLEELENRAAMVPDEIQRAHTHLVTGVRLQVSAWRSIRDGITRETPDLIHDGSEQITLSRRAISESRLSIPDCSLVSD